MTQFNDKLRGALDETSTDDMSLREMRELLTRSFTGRANWIMAGAWLKLLAFFVLAIVAAVQFFRTDSTRAMIAWAAGFIVCTSAMGMMATFFWMQLNRNAITREIKRLELAIARILEDKH
jgi:hypothetical protein